MGDTIVGKPSAAGQTTRSTQPFILSGSKNRVPALTGWGKGGNITSAGWHVALCEHILLWHVSFRSSEASANFDTRLLNYPHQR